MDALTERIVTGDGSHSLLRVDLNETYHSTKGAIQEARHVYISRGLDSCSTDASPLHLFEMGIGTGLNALLAFDWATRQQRKVVYYGIDNTVLPIAILNDLNYAQTLDLKPAFSAFHEAEWGIPHSLSQYFSFVKIEQHLEDYVHTVNYDCVFYDAFAPKYQPEVWDSNILATIYSHLNNEGVFVTYCCSGKLVRFFRSLPVTVNKLPGPPGKREMLQIINH